MAPSFPPFFLRTLRVLQSALRHADQPEEVLRFISQSETVCLGACAACKMGMRLFVRVLDGTVVIVDNCSMRMTVAELQRRICEELRGGMEDQKVECDAVERSWFHAPEQLVMSFGGEYAAPDRTLADFGLCEKFIIHASGFVVESHDLPAVASSLKKYIDGELVPLSTAEPDYDVYYPPLTTTIFPSATSKND